MNNVFNLLLLLSNNIIIIIKLRYYSYKTRYLDKTRFEITKWQ